MEIFLKDPKQPGFIINGEPGKVLESFHRMQQLAIMLKKQPFTLIYNPVHGYVTETNHPYLVKKKNYSKKMHIILGFYGIGFPAHGPVPTDMQHGTLKRNPVQPIPGRIPPGQMGFCCVRGRVIEAPAHACQAEHGAFFHDAEQAHRHCK
jgi:hypothetical protein